MPGGRAASRIGEILECSAQFYADVLWSSETGKSVRARLAEADIDDQVLRRFQVGYSPVQPRQLLDHLAPRRYSAPELLEAGVVSRSGRDHLHARFHSRIMFPIRDADSNLRGFAGLATHLGPSWPLWLVSPDEGPFQREAVLFGIDQAGRGIAKTGRALVLNDCLEVVRLHAAGSTNAIALAQSPLTETHRELIAEELGLAAGEVAAAEISPGGKTSKSVIVVGREDAVEEARSAPQAKRSMPVPAKPAELTVAESGGPDPNEMLVEPEKPTPLQRVYRAIVATAVGAGLPLIWLAVVRPSGDGGDRGYEFGLVALGVGISFGVLALAGARISARARARSAERRMRAPYLHGSTEWQPPAWTYHRIEDLLIGAAVVSMLILVALFMTIGGFTGWNTD